MNNLRIGSFFNTYKILFIIFIVAMVLRIGLNVAREELFFQRSFLVSGDQFLKHPPTDDRTSSDSLWYIYAAKGFLENKGVVSSKKFFMPENLNSIEKAHFGFMNIKKIDEEHYTHKGFPPLYPLFLAFCFAIGGFNTLAFFVPQIILSSFTCILIYLISEEIFNKQIALIAGFAVAFHPDSIFWSSFARTETLFIFLFVLGFFLLIKGNLRKNVRLIYISAAAFGLACLTRITFTPFVPILFFWQVYAFSKNRKKSFKVAIIMGLIIFAVLLPWGIRNYVLFGEFNILTEEAGILVGTIENKEQYNDVELNKEYRSHESLFLRIPVFIKDNIETYLASCWRRFLRFWSPFTHVMKPWAKVYKGITWFIIFPASFWGMIASRKKWK